jgi:hypothetical protein
MAGQIIVEITHSLPYILLSEPASLVEHFYHLFLLLSLFAGSFLLVLVRGKLWIDRSLGVASVIAVGWVRSGVHHALGPDR